jgi:hypothetical protein
MWQRRHIRRAAKWGFLAIVVAIALYLLQRVIFVLYIAYLLYARDFMDASAKNGRGDVASAETDFYEASDHRVTTVIRLKRAGHWFSTTLVEARSLGVLIGLNWRNDDALDLPLDFGCKPEMAQPVTVVGPIHIVYHWGDPGHLPKGGYESFRRRDLPPVPCP